MRTTSSRPRKESTYTYDDNGNRISKSDGTTYIYDFENRLTEVKVNGTTIATYQYDAYNRRIRKTAGGTVTGFVYLPEGLYAEYDGTGTEIRRYLYNPQSTFMTDPLAMIEDSNAYYYHNDHLGTPQLMTDATQTVVWQADYSAFGSASVTTGTVTNNLRYPGQYYDSETGLHYNWHRYYDPATGRYLSPDPSHQLQPNVQNAVMPGIPYLLPSLLTEPQRLNGYVYVRNNPLMWIDPLGLEECCSGGGKPYFHSNEYWSCVAEKVLTNAPVYITGIILVGIPEGPGQVVAAVGVASLANLHGYQCRMRATHCD